MKTKPKSTAGRRTVGAILTAAALAVGFGSQVASAQTLPDPGTGYDVQYDDFRSYSIPVLDYFFPTAGWDTTAGTGTLDVIITTRSSGQTNTDIAGDIYQIPDPITNPNTSPIAQSWGAGSTVELQMAVSNLYAYLWNTFQASIPVFTFDQNETGGNPDLLVTALVEIINPDTSTAVASWSLDGINNSSYDPGSPVTAPGETCIPDVLDQYNPPGTADLVCFSNNVGSGSFDYIVFAPSMDLTPWKDTDYLFKVSWVFANVDDGGEEITLTGRFAPTVVPIAGSLPLLGLGFGLLALGGAVRRRMA